MTEPIANFDQLLSEQIQAENEERQVKRQVKKKERKHRWKTKLGPEKEDEFKAKNRKYNRVKYHQQAANMSTATPDDLLAMIQSNQERHAIEDAVYHDRNNALTNALLQQQSELHAERAHQRQKQVEDGKVAYELLELIKGSTSEAPMPQPNPFDTPLRPIKRSAECMASPSIKESTSKKGKSLFRPIFGAIGEDNHDEQSPSVTFRLSVAALDGENAGQVMETSISLVGVKGFAQVADCTVVLTSEGLRPISFLKKINPSLTTRMFSLTTRKPSFELCTDELGPLPLDDAVTEIFSGINSSGAWLVAKGFADKYHAWKYIENTGTFSAPVTFSLKADGARAIVGDALVGFDELNLASKKHHAVLRKAEFSLNKGDGNVFSVLDATKEEDLFLSKNRLSAKIVGCGARPFVLAWKKVGSNRLGFIFGESNGRFVKVPGFSEGHIVDIAGNATHVFALDVNGNVFFTPSDIDLESLSGKTQPWIEFKASDGDSSIALDSISSFTGGCMGIRGTQAYFLFPTVDGCDITIKDLDMSTLLYMSGSGVYTACFGTEKAEGEETGGEDIIDDKKPAAK